MKEKDIQDLQNAVESVENVQTVKQAEARIKELKKGIRKLEIAVVAIGLGILSLIILPIIGIISFNITLALTIVGGIALIVKAFKDGEVLELEKYFLELVYKQSNNTKDGE
jgi:cell division protein FtsX